MLLAQMPPANVAETDIDAYRAHQHLLPPDDLLGRRVRGDTVQIRMELVVQLHDRAHVAALQRRLVPIFDLVELGQLKRRCDLRQPPRKIGFHRFQNAANIGGTLSGHFAHPCTAVVFKLDQPLAFELLQRFADRDRADLVAIRKIADPQLTAGRQRTAANIQTHLFDERLTTQLFGNRIAGRRQGVRGRFHC